MIRRRHGSPFASRGIRGLLGLALPLACTDPTEGQLDGNPGSETDAVVPSGGLEDASGSELGISGIDGGDSSTPGSNAESSLIWIANSTEGTVSKIDTRSFQEIGRYLVRSDGAGDPSRTSVNLRGDMAVANRRGGVTKVWARREDCRESNGQAGIQSSQDARFLPWGEDECIAWHLPLDYDSQRAIAWQPDPEDGSTPDLWVSGARETSNTIDILLIDGDTGTVRARAAYPADAMTGGAYPFGAYGGAVDAEGNFWFTNKDYGELVRVRAGSLEVDTWDKPHHSYGLTVDPRGRVWTCTNVIARFDPDTESWDRAPEELGLPGGERGFAGGCMMDRHGRLWMGGSADGREFSLLAIDGDSLQAIEAIPLPGHVTGVAIDRDDFVWVVSIIGNAFKVDPDTRMFETFHGLVNPYTYSDMTGLALRSVVNPQ